MFFLGFSDVTPHLGPFYQCMRLGKSTECGTRECEDSTYDSYPQDTTLPACQKKLTAEKIHHRLESAGGMPQPNLYEGGRQISFCTKCGVYDLIY